jgi:hypothetical protein
LFCQNYTVSLLYGPTAPVGIGLIIVEVAEHTQDTPHSLGLLWTSDLARRGDPYLTTHSTHTKHTFMPPVGFEPAFPASERPRTHGNCTVSKL